MSSVDRDDEQASPPNSRQSLIHLALFTSLFIPLACIPYIPIRRHLLGLKKSIHVLSANTLAVQHELNTTLLQARLLKEEKLQLVNQLSDIQDQLDAVRAQVANAESDRLLIEKKVFNRLEAFAQSAALGESTRLRVDEELRRQLDMVKRDRLPIEMLCDMSASLADVASFIEEVEIQRGWSHSNPRDRGIDRMRQLALKIHTIAKGEPPNDHDAQ